MTSTTCKRLLIRGGTLRNPPTPEARPALDILIEDDLIAHVAPEIIADNARVIDASGTTIIPGLINMHVHITRRHLHLQPATHPFRLGAPEVENAPDEMRVLWALRNAWTELAEGVTTVRDAGSKHHVSIRLRDAFRQGIFPGPTLLAVGEPVAITGGHETHRYHGAREADGPSEVRKAVREQLREGADWIKLMASAGIGGMPHREHPSYTEFTKEELIAGAQEAHKRGRQVMAHAMADESILFCIEAGVDTVEHGVLAAEPTVRRMARAGTALVPTMSGIETVYKREIAAGDAHFAERLRSDVIEPHRRAVSMCIEEGICVSTGSDTLGSVAEEISLLVNCGMGLEQALTAATLDAARLLGMENQIGSIDIGKRADLVLLTEDPLVTMNAYSQIKEVVFGGRLLSETVQNDCIGT